MIVTDRTRMFQAHFVAASSRNKEWPGKQHSKLISECGAEGTRTRRSEGMGRVGTRMRGASLAVEAALRQSRAATLDCELLFHRSTDEPDKIDACNGTTAPVPPGPL